MGLSSKRVAATYERKKEIEKLLASWGWEEERRRIAEGTYYVWTKRFRLKVTAYIIGEDLHFSVSPRHDSDYEIGKDDKREIPLSRVTEETVNKTVRELVRWGLSLKPKHVVEIDMADVDAAVYWFVHKDDVNTLNSIADHFTGFVEPYHHKSIRKNEVRAALLRLRRQGLIHNHDGRGTLGIWKALPGSSLKYWNTTEALRADYGYSNEDMPRPKAPVPAKPEPWDEEWRKIYMPEGRLLYRHPLD